MRGLLACLFMAACTSVSAAPLQVIAPETSQCKPAVQISSYLSGSKVGSSASCAVLGVLDLTGDGSGCSTANALLATSFATSSDANGVCLDSSETSAVLLAQFDVMFSSKFCGSKATDFVGLLADSLLVMLPAVEVAELVASHDQTLRRIATAVKKRAAAGNPIRTIVFVTPDASARAADDISLAFEGVRADIGEEGRLLEVKVLAVNSKDAESVNSAKVFVSSLRSAEEVATSSLGSKIVESWGKVASGVPRPVLSPAERQSVSAIESAFTVGVAQSEAAFNQWQGRIASGKPVGKFGTRVQELLDGVHKRFMEQTRGSVSVRERAQRASQLREGIESTGAVLFRQQLALLQTMVTNRFRKTLINLAVTSDPSTQTEEEIKNNEQQALRKALFDFRTMALELEVESLGLSSTSAQTDLSAALQTLITEFPESSFGRLEAAKKVEKETKRPRKKKGAAGKRGSRAVNIGLNLVGMLRPPGYGNLQGFVGYSTALLGLPFEILMGVQNDGDSPEILGEDREYPLLRLQPKVSFDIDV